MTDTQRLDWLIRKGPPGASDGIGLTRETWDAGESEINSKTVTKLGDLHLIRLAIDRAMKEKE